MNDQISEELSALMDDQLAAPRDKALFDRLRTDDELRRRWGRYHEIGDMIRNEAPGLQLAGLAERIREQIADEPAILAAPRPRTGHSATAPGKVSWSQAAAGAALAASVAGVSVYLYGQMPGQLPVAAPIVAQTVVQTSPGTNLMQVAQTSISPAPATPVVEGHWKKLPQPTNDSKLNRYLVDHSEYSAPGGMAGILPYATFVTYDPKR